jgi:hypothetical protein
VVTNCDAARSTWRIPLGLVSRSAPVSESDAGSEERLSGSAQPYAAFKPSILERKVFKMGDELSRRKPTVTSIVGASPSSGRLTTDQGRKFFAEAGKIATPRLDATSEIAIA